MASKIYVLADLKSEWTNVILGLLAKDGNAVDSYFTFGPQASTPKSGRTGARPQG